MIHREAIDTWLERGILALVLGALAFGTLAFGGERPADFVILWWLILAALGLWLARIWLAPKFRFLWPPICWAILPFVAYAIWRWRTADIEILARQEVMHVVLCALLFLIVINNLYGQNSVRILKLSLVFLGMAVAMYGIYQWLRHSPTVWGFPRPTAYLERASGTFICPNHLAGFLEMTTPLAIALAVAGRLKPVLRICVIYAALVMLVGIAATQSRGGWAGAAAGLGLLAFLFAGAQRRRWTALAIVVVVAAAGAWLYPRSVAKRITSAQYSGNNKEVRLRLWVAASKMWQGNPWWGVGPNHFDYRYGAFRDETNTSQGRPGRVHNDYLNTLADYGLVGLLLALVPLGFGIAAVKRCWPHVFRSGSDFNDKKSNRSAVLLGTSAGLVSLLVHSFFDFNLHIPANAFLFVTLLAILCSHLRFATESYWFTARWSVATVASVILAAALAWMGQAALTRTREVALLMRADSHLDGSPEKIALLKRAFAIEPKNFETAYAIGEQLRALAWLGHDDNKARAQEALVWFERALALNKWDAMGHLRAGMCLDWMGQTAEAEPHFAQALKLEPNHWRVRAKLGWHEFQKGNYKAAHEWFGKSLRLNWTDNPTAYTYFNLTERYLREEAAGFQWPQGLHR